MVSPSEAISRIAMPRAFDVACVHALTRNGSVCQKERQETENDDSEADGGRASSRRLSSPLIENTLQKFKKKQFEDTCSIELKEEVLASLPHPLAVHANSSIQYISEYRAALSGLLALAPEIFIVAHTPVSDANLAQQQLNNPHRRLARWVFNRGRFVPEIEKAGYRIAITYDQDVAATYKMAPGPLTDTSMVFYRSPAIN